MTVDLEHLGRSLKRAQDRDHRALDAALRPLGISLVQWDALKAIGQNPGASSHELALATFQSDQACGTLAGRLVGAGWVVRHGGEGRRLSHHLTEAGRSIHARGRVLVSEELQHLFERLSESDRSTLQGLLGKLLT
jgi:DNA-binding MarR family transcriptional regulator